jgi:FMN-dependent NADH-azoreductase
LLAGRPDAEVIYRDVSAAPVPHLSGATMAALQNGGGDNDPAVTADIALGGQVLGEFLAADTIVVGVAFYNFTVPSQLKAWIDRIVIVGQTFRYGDDGRPEGLAGAKRVILAIARGGHYGPGAPAEALEHAETYLRGVFGFLGITDLEVVAAEGLRMGPEQRAAAITDAEKRIAALAA